MLLLIGGQLFESEKDESLDNAVPRASERILHLSLTRTYVKHERGFITFNPDECFVLLAGEVAFFDVASPKKYFGKLHSGDSLLILISNGRGSSGIRCVIDFSSEFVIQWEEILSRFNRDATLPGAHISQEECERYAKNATECTRCLCRLWELRATDEEIAKLEQAEPQKGPS